MKRKIFDVKKVLCVGMAVVLLAMPLSMRVYADEECTVFNPAFALCSTHTHNAGFLDKDGKFPVNPTAANDIEYMNEVIALKATVIAQQLKQQYDTLNTVIKRFKTQLEKAVLTSKMEILTGTASGSSSSGSNASSSATSGLSNAEDCDSYTGVNTYDCLVRNLSKIKSAVDKDIRMAREQLAIDIEIINDGQMCRENGKKVVCSDEGKKCENWKNLYKTDLVKCIEYLNRSVKNARDEYETERNRYERR